MVYILYNHLFMKFSTLTISIFLSFCNFIYAQFPTDGQYQSIFTNATPEMPNYLNSVVDNTVPSPINIKRVTKYFEAWNWYPSLDYPKIQNWNADQSLYRISSWKVFDAQTHKEVQDLPGGSIYPSSWSNTNPDLIYSFQEDGKIKKYFVATNSIQTVDNIQGYEYIKLGPGEGNIDKNDNFVALVGKKGIDLDVIVYDLQNLKIIHTETFEGAWAEGNRLGIAYPKYIDWVSISQSGDYIGIMWDHNATSKNNPFNTHYGVEIYNTSDMQYLRRVAVYGNHGDFGYAANGDEVFVQFWGSTGTVNMYYLDRMERLVIATHSDFNGAGHLSCRNINRPGWTYLTQSSSAQSGQIIALKLDDSGIVEHFGHHFSSYANSNKVALAVPSPNGDKVMFNSDFGDAANKDLAYIFEGTLASNLAVENFNNTTFKLYPNPTKNNVIIESNHTINTILIFNSIGQKIKTILDVNTLSTEINTEQLNEGVYFIKLTTNNGNYYSRKFVKN